MATDLFPFTARTARTGQIKSIKFDGCDLLVINITIMMYPFDLVVFDSYVYWTNWRHKSIYRINKYSGQELKLVASKAHYPMGSVSDPSNLMLFI
jgi:hypothetical protein